MLEVYGVQGLEEHRKGSVLINNYPVRIVKVFGRVLSYVHKNYDVGGVANPNNFFLITVDDCSGDLSHINAKIPESCVFDSFSEDSYVQIVGHVLFVKDYLRQIIGHNLTVLSRGPDLAIEIECLRQVLAARKCLQQPWRYTPEWVPLKGCPSEPRFSKKDYLVRLEKLRLEFSDPASQAPHVFHLSDSFTDHDTLPFLDKPLTTTESEFCARGSFPRAHKYTLNEEDGSDTDPDEAPQNFKLSEELHIIVLD